MSHLGTARACLRAGLDGMPAVGHQMVLQMSLASPGHSCPHSCPRCLSCHAGTPQSEQLYKLAELEDDPLLSFLLKQGRLLGAGTGSSKLGSSASAAGSGAKRGGSQHADMDLSPWEIPFSDLALQKSIGQGSYGKVGLKGHACTRPADIGSF